MIMKNVWIHMVFEVATHFLPTVWLSALGRSSIRENETPPASEAEIAQHRSTNSFTGNEQRGPPKPHKRKDVFVLFEFSFLHWLWWFSFVISQICEQNRFMWISSCAVLVPAHTQTVRFCQFCWRGVFHFYIFKSCFQTNYGIWMWFYGSPK